MSSWWYHGERDGRRFNWAKEPSYTCPNLPDGQPFDARPDEDPLRGRVTAAAAALEVAPDKLLGALRRMHSGGVDRVRVDGKLTDRCSGCGAKLEREGFRAWIDEPGSWDDYSGATRQLNQMLGSDPPRRLIRTTWHATKRAAAEWASHEHTRHTNRKETTR